MKPDGDPVVVGRYAMYGVIGSGGMATVHLGRASDAGASSDVFAIKRLRPHLAAEPDIVRSFLDEARLSSRIAHPNVVPTLEVVTEGSEVFLVMPYVEGVSLAALVRASAGSGSRRVPAPVAVAVVAGMLRGLHAAHEAVGDTGEPLRIVHRDVSPQNVLIGVDGTAHVLDFGVAKALGRQQTTRDGQIKGKLGYMAPEQLSGRGVTRRTDVFAAGIVLWELLTGRRLFRADDEAATVARVLMEPVRPPSEVEPASPAALDPIVLRALERDPSKRFLTADEMACALEEAVSSATPQEVGAWVRSIAEAELVERAVGPRPVDAGRRRGAHAHRAEGGGPSSWPHGSRRGPRGRRPRCSGMGGRELPHVSLAGPVGVGLGVGVGVGVRVGVRVRVRVRASARARDRARARVRARPSSSLTAPRCVALSPLFPAPSTALLRAPPPAASASTPRTDLPVSKTRLLPSPEGDTPFAAGEPRSSNPANRRRSGVAASGHTRCSPPPRRCPCSVRSLAFSPSSRLP